VVKMCKFLKLGYWDLDFFFFNLCLIDWENVCVFLSSNNICKQYD
jgi:hypothetical protein